MERTIVVGVDGSPGAEAALEWALRDAARCGGTVQVVHGYSASVAWIDVGSAEEDDMRRRSHERATALAKRVVERAAARRDVCNVDIDVAVSEGDAAAVLVDAAADADLLVVGSRGRGGFTGVLLGSVSQRCAQHASCPVVIVPSGPSASPERDVGP